MGGKADVLQHIMFRAGISEADIAELDLAPRAEAGVRDRAILDGERRVQNLQNTLGGHRCTRQKDKDHHKQHKRHDDLHCVLGENDHVRKQRDLLRHLRAVDQSRADPINRKTQPVHYKLHRRHQNCHCPAGKQVRRGQRLVALIEFLLLIALGVVSAHNAQTGQILPRDAVEIVRQTLELFEFRQHQQHGKRSDKDQDRDRDSSGDRPLRALAGDLGDRPCRHDRCLDDGLQTEHDQHLHLRDIVGRAGDEACR